MARTKFPEHRPLAKRNTERERQIKRLAKLVSSTTEKYGKELERVTGSGHIKVKHELKVGAYRITATYGMTMMGGNQIDIVFERKPAFSLYWQVGLDECKVELWDESVEWYDKLILLLGSKKRLEQQLKIEAGNDPASVRTSAREQQRREEKEALQTRAKQLGLRV